MNSALRMMVKVLLPLMVIGVSVGVAGSLIRNRPKQEKKVEFTVCGGECQEDATAQSACAPVNLTRVPNLSSLLAFLIPLQLILGLIVLRRRRSPGGEEP